MIRELPKLPPLPEYDGKRDGNPFVFIVREAPKANAQRRDAFERFRRRNRFIP